jgi:histidinol-phosphate aminotransferase
VVLRSLSKVHGLAGLRVGYGLAPRELVQAANGLCQQYNLGSLAQAAALAAFNDGEHLARTVDNNRRERDVMQRALSGLGLVSLPSGGNFILVRAAGTIVDALESRGVRVKPMERYGAVGCFRVSVGLPEENARFLAALAETLQELAPDGRMNYA